MGDAARKIGGRDQLEYLADLLGEMQRIAEDNGAKTLASLIALAQVEATREAASRKA